jgi:hypothetical protein
MHIPSHSWGAEARWQVVRLTGLWTRTNMLLKGVRRRIGTRPRSLIYINNTRPHQPTLQTNIAMHLALLSLLHSRLASYIFIVSYNIVLVQIYSP